MVGDREMEVVQKSQEDDSVNSFMHFPLIEIAIMALLTTSANDQSAQIFSVHPHPSSDI